jgi:hypothetical protein
VAYSNGTDPVIVRSAIRDGYGGYIGPEDAARSDTLTHFLPADKNKE